MLKGGHDEQILLDTHLTSALFSLALNKEGEQVDTDLTHFVLSFFLSDLHSIESREGNLPFQRHSCLVHLKPLQPSKEGSH